MAEVTDSELKETHETVKRPYFLVLMGLLLLTILEVNLGFAGDLTTDSFMSSMIIAGLIILALVKAYLVGAYFMGIKYLKHPKLITAGVFGIPLFIAIPIAAFPVLGTALYLCGI